MKSITHNNFYAYLLILLTFFILLFFTRGVFSQTQILLDEGENLKQTETEKRDILTELNELKNMLNQEGSDELKNIQGLTGEVNTHNILEYLHNYAGTINTGEERIIMRNISIKTDQQSDIGFKKALIDVSAIISSEETLFGFLEYLTNPDGEYRFFISQLSYPMNEGVQNMQVNIPLTLYYK